MHLLNATTDVIQAGAAIGTFLLAVVTACIAWRTRKQGKKIADLELMIDELKKQTRLLAKDVSINQNRLELQELETQYETGPFFDSGHSRPVDVAMIIVEIINMGRTANKVRAVTNHERVKEIKCQTHAIRNRMSIQVFVKTDQENRFNHSFTFLLQFSGQGQQWFEQDVVNKSDGTITVSERRRIDRAID